MNGWKDWQGKKVYIKLKGGRVYTGKVVKIDDRDEHHPLISIVDQYGRDVAFDVSEIKLIQQEAA
ncbi:MAG: hypothetical protein FJZ63_02105 [Chlamydiae bacterium]|nr:hypothetical protein [Chlamydiota bacterium]